MSDTINTCNSNNSACDQAPRVEVLTFRLGGEQYGLAMGVPGPALAA